MKESWAKAFKEGCEAFLVGESLENYPYKKDSEEYYKWRQGWKSEDLNSRSKNVVGKLSDKELAQLLLSSMNSDDRIEEWPQLMPLLARLSEQPENLTCFEMRLASIINEFSQENGSNTPDFILAHYLRACLSAFNIASRRREAWYGKELKICDTGEPLKEKL